MLCPTKLEVGLFELRYEHVGGEQPERCLAVRWAAGRCLQANGCCFTLGWQSLEQLRN